MDYNIIIENPGLCFRHDECNGILERINYVHLVNVNKNNYYNDRVMFARAYLYCNHNILHESFSDSIFSGARIHFWEWGLELLLVAFNSNGFRSDNIFCRFFFFNKL